MSFNKSFRICDDQYHSCKFWESKYKKQFAELKRNALKWQVMSYLSVDRLLKESIDQGLTEKEAKDLMISIYEKDK